MILTLNWLKRFLNFSSKAQEITDALNHVGFEVESVTDKGAIYSSFKIAKIISAVPHTDSERLQVCMVDDGKSVLQIVCGAANARQGLYVVLAPVGTSIPSNGMIIKQSRIRNVESCGMLCSSEELNLGMGDGIIELPSDIKIGTSFADYANMNDVVWDIAINPNRGDALSVQGLARELAAAGIGELLEHSGKAKMDEHGVAIHVPEDCYEFCITKISEIDNTGSIEDISQLLVSAQQKSISPLVDISNYVMLSYGRPNHMYDADKINGEIRVRKSKKLEKFLALNGETYNLPEGILVIADDVKVLSVAGVIGGEDSKVDGNTKNVLLEVAHFSPEAVAISGRALNIHTESRHRFERNIDPASTEMIIGRAVELVKQYCKGSVISTSRSEGLEIKYIKSLPVEYEKIRKILGENIANAEIDSLMSKLSCNIIDGVAQIPSWRWHDIKITEDIAEEIFRMRGSNMMKSQKMSMPTQMPASVGNKEYQLKLWIAANRGLHEVVTWSFMDSVDAEKFGFKPEILLENPISSELNAMRPSIIPNLLSAAQHNLNHSASDFGLFEFGNIYGLEYANAAMQYQAKCIAGIRVGNIEKRSVHGKARNLDFFDLKADVFEIIKRYGFKDTDSIRLSRNAPGYYHTMQSITLSLGKTVIGYAGMIHPVLSKQYDIKEKVGFFEIFLDRMPAPKGILQKNAKFSDLQPIYRDFAIILDKNVEAASIAHAVKSLKNSLICDVKIFDVYEGKGMDENMKSIAFSVTIQPQGKTMTEAEIESLSAQIIEAIEKKGGKLRK